MTAPAIEAVPRSMFAARYGRLVSAGLQSEPGDLAELPAWWGRDHWVDVEVWCAVNANRDLARSFHVEPDTAVRVARAHARYADFRTGRGCRPTNERLAADLQMSVRQIQRARGLLKALQLMTETMRGRSFMTRTERLQAWRNGSSHRKIAAEFALTSLRRPQGRRLLVERVIPSLDLEVRGLSSEIRGFSPGRDRRRNGASPRTHSQSRRPRPARPGEAQSRRLIAGVQRRVPWLSGVSPRRLTVLHRFARQGWTERDVERAIGEVLRARSWSVPDELSQPAAYLATLLRDVDPGDRPGALEEARLAEERVRREWLWRVNFGNEPECAHGQPLGDQPHPISRVVVCPLCRAG